MTRHPSFFALDALRLGVSTDASVREHTTGCDTCRQHVEAGVATAVPSWVSTRPPRRSPREWRWLGAVAFVVICAMGAIMATVLTRDVNDGYRTKGGAVGLLFHVKRGDQVFVWNERDTLNDGDQLQLSVATERPSTVRVSSAASLLFEGRIDAGEHTLPLSWRLTDDGVVTELEVTVEADGQRTQRRFRVQVRRGDGAQP